MSRFRATAIDLDSFAPTSIFANRRADAEVWYNVWQGSPRVRPFSRSGRLLVDGVLCPTECANGTRVWVCRHVDGTISLALNKPDLSTVLQVVFTNNPKVKRG